MFSGDLFSQPWFGGAVIAILVLLIAGWALSHFDPFDVEERIAKPVGHDALDSMAEWGCNASSQALRRFNESENARAKERMDAAMHAAAARAVRSHCVRYANASIGIQAAITARAARDDRVLGFHILDEDGDVDTVPPLTADQEAMLRKIDLVELQVVTHDRWRDLAGFRPFVAASMPAFPVSLLDRGVSIPPAHCGEVLA